MVVATTCTCFELSTSKNHSVEKVKLHAHVFRLVVTVVVFCVLRVVLSVVVDPACRYAYSDQIKTLGKATSQGSSGRCWIFACMNVIRLKLIAKFNLPTDFELSQSYLYFFDKLERCQYFFENILETSGEVCLFVPYDVR